MKHPSTEQARRDVYRASTALLVAERVNRSTWEEKGRVEAVEQKGTRFLWDDPKTGMVRLNPEEYRKLLQKYVA